jgi:hypothetical protein
VALALTGMAALALGVSNSRWEMGDTAEAAATFEQRWPVFETNAPTGSIPADAHARTPEPFQTLSSAPEDKPELQTPIRLASLDPDARSIDVRSLDVDDSSQPARTKGYIFYFNSPTHWAPVPLPEAISEPRAPHNNNIRSEIEQAAMAFGVDIRMMKAFARIESGFNPKVTTGKYKCLFQLSNYEFSKYWKGDIYDIRDCSMAAARKFATEAAEFEKDVGRPATATEIYLIHQQGYQGCSFHYDAPHQLAWKNMYLTAEGQERGEAWARKAIWGNVPSDIKDKIKGGVEALTSAQFIAIWQERVERFMERKVEPPSDYVERAVKTRSKSKLAAAGKKSKMASAGKKSKVASKEKKSKLAAATRKKAASNGAVKKKGKVKVAAR